MAWLATASFSFKALTVLVSLAALAWLLLHLLQLLGSNALLLGGLDLGLLQIKIKGGLFASHGKITDLVQLLAALGEGDLVLANLRMPREKYSPFLLVFRCTSSRCRC